MKKRVLKLIILSLISAMTLGVFASCGSLLNINHSRDAYAFFDENANNYFDKEMTVTLSELSSIYEGTVNEITGNLARFVKKNDDGTKTNYIYNLSTGKLLYSTSDNDINISLENAGFTVKIDDTVYLYDACGDNVFSSTTEKASNQKIQHSKSGHFLEFDNCCFRTDEDGHLQKIETVIPDALFDAYFFNNYYYYLSDSIIIIFDREYNLIASHEMNYPLATAVNTFVLSNGLVAIQCIENITDENTYDFIDGDGNKHNLKTYLLNPVGNYVSQPNCKFLISHSMNMEYNVLSNYSVSYLFNQTVPYNKNCMIVQTINKDKTLDNAQICVVYPENLSMVLKVSDLYEHSRYIACFAKDRFSVTVGDKTCQILDANLKCIAQGNLVSFYETNKYIISVETGCIYDSNMELLFDYYHEGYIFNSVVGDNIILNKDGMAYLYDGKDMLTKIGNADLVTVEYNELIVVADSLIDTKCKYYDSDMNLLLTSETGKMRWLSDDVNPNVDVFSKIGVAVDFLGNYKNYILTIELK